MKSKSQSGMAHVVLLILIMLVLGAIVYAGVRVMQNQNTGENQTGSVPVAKTAVPKTISNASDLNTATSALNQENVDGDLNPDSLNADVSSVL